MSFLPLIPWYLCFACLLPLNLQAKGYAEIPFQEESGLIIVTVKIAERPYRFLLDSGASETVVSPRLAKKYHWRRVGKIRITDTNGQQKLLARVKIPALKVANYRFRNNLAHVQDFSESGALADLKIDGILGASLLRKAYWQIDFQAQTIKVFTDAQFLPPKTRTSFIPFTSIGNYGQAYVQLSMGQDRIQNVLVDLGYNGELELPSSCLQAIAQTNDIRIFRGQTQSPSGLYGSRGRQDILLANLEQLKIGTHRVSTLAKGRMQAKAKLGTAFLRSFVLTLDWKGGGMFLEE